MNTGIIFESKNGRWVITRGKDRYSVRDKESGKRYIFNRTGDSVQCNGTIPAYLTKHITKDAAMVNTYEERQAVIAGGE